MHGLSLAAVSWGPSWLHTGFSLWRFLCCGAQALGAQASVVAAHRLHSCRLWAQKLQLAGPKALVVVALGCTCSTACGILLDQGLHPHFPHWQSNSHPLYHQGSPYILHFWIALQSAFDLLYMISMKHLWLQNEQYIWKQSYQCVIKHEIGSQVDELVLLGR